MSVADEKIKWLIALLVVFALVLIYLNPSVREVSLMLIVGALAMYARFKQQTPDPSAAAKASAAAEPFAAAEKFTGFGLADYPGAVGGHTDELATNYADPDAPLGIATTPGNHYNFMRSHANRAASACVDDEANDDSLDGDERIARNSLARNEPTRAEAGTMNRRKVLDTPLREEVAEREQDAWWGRYEK